MGRKSTGSRKSAACWACLVVAFLSPNTAHAGMPSVGFTELARLRLEAISFFLVVLLLSAGVVCLLWNWLRSDFTRLPRLSYGKALGVVVLWGLLFVVVLTMISGARELMTPGAWEKNGATYKLRDDSENVVEVADIDQTRREKLKLLYTALATFAATHDGRYPTAEELELFPQELLQVDGAPGVKFAYAPPAADIEKTQVIAFEPVAYSRDPFALFSDGEIRVVSFDEIVQSRNVESPQ